MIAPFVRRRQPVDDLLRGQALAEQDQALRAVARVRVGLRRDRASARLGPGNDRADGEELRLGRDAPLAGLEIAGRDGVGGYDYDRLSHR